MKAGLLYLPSCDKLLTILEIGLQRFLCLIDYQQMYSCCLPLDKENNNLSKYSRCKLVDLKNHCHFAILFNDIVLQIKSYVRGEGQDERSGQEEMVEEYTHELDLSGYGSKIEDI